MSAGWWLKPSGVEVTTGDLHTRGYYPKPGEREPTGRALGLEVRYLWDGAWMEARYGTEPCAHFADLAAQALRDREATR